MATLRRGLATTTSKMTRVVAAAAPRRWAVSSSVAFALAPSALARWTHPGKVARFPAVAAGHVERLRAVFGHMAPLAAPTADDIALDLLAGLVAAHGHVSNLAASVAGLVWAVLGSVTNPVA